MKAALADLFQRYQRFVRDQVRAHRKERGGDARREAGSGRGVAEEIEAGLSAWALVGLGTLMGITQELGLVEPAQQRKLFASIGRVLLNGS